MVKINSLSDIEKILWAEGLKNAIKFNGKANAKAVMGKLMKERPELRSQGKMIKPKVQDIVNEINKIPIEEQKKIVLQLDPHALDIEKPKGPEKKVLPPLPNAKDGKVVMRLAPYPSGALHIGNARMIVLNDEYVKRYNGKLLLVYDDTIGTTLGKINDPKAKYVIPEAYDLIDEGLEWLGVKIHKKHYKSDRVEIYQEEAGKLIANGDAYVCTCPAEEFRTKYKRPGKPCPCRSKTLEYHIDMYEKMKEGKIAEGAAVVRLKTGMDQKDPALRDHIIMRISDAPHPRIGTKVRLWPVLEFSWGLDDHLLGITHIIRGIDLRKEGQIEQFIWDLYGWEHSNITLYGRLKFSDEFKLSKTLARQRIQSGEYEGWSDPRTWSLQSLRERGIQPQAVREALLDLGLSKRGIVFDKTWIYSKNTKLIDDEANRYWFVENPVKMQIKNIPSNLESLVASPLLHPNHPDRGTRNVVVSVKDGISNLYIPLDDLSKLTGDGGKIIHPALKEGEAVRLKDLCNVKIEKIIDQKLVEAYYLSTEKMPNIRKIQFIPAEQPVNIRVLQPEGYITKGLGEKALRNLNEGMIIQFERYGFVRIKSNKNGELYAYFTNS